MGFAWSWLHSRSASTLHRFMLIDWFQRLGLFIASRTGYIGKQKGGWQHCRNVECVVAPVHLLGIVPTGGEVAK